MDPAKQKNYVKMFNFKYLQDKFGGENGQVTKQTT